MNLMNLIENFVMMRSLRYLLLASLHVNIFVRVNDTHTHTHTHTTHVKKKSSRVSDLHTHTHTHTRLHSPTPTAPTLSPFALPGAMAAGIVSRYKTGLRLDTNR